MAKRVSQEDKYKKINGVPYKLCSTCKEFKPLDEYSARNASADGLSYSCKSCERATAQKSYKKIKAKKQSAQRYTDHKEEYKERAKIRYQDNPEAALAYQKEWRSTKKGKAIVQAAAARRQKRLNDQTPGGKDYTKEDVISRDSKNGVLRCQICHAPITNMGELHIDHIIPVAQGGSDTLDNVRCVHRKCNLTRPKDGTDL